MDEYKEAIDAIRANYPPENYTMLREGLDLAIITLKKQIPEKPIEYTELPNRELSYLCPTCNRLYWEWSLISHYCSSCGQRFELD